ncbi:MAG: T9SS type A sorting domain-containing protein, partial [Salibacteraceae bacterium]
ENLLIKDNEINNVQYRGIVLNSGSGKIKKARIEGNSFYASSVWAGSNDANVMSFIYINNGEEHEIIGNYFGGSTAKCAGNKMNLDMAALSNKLFVYRVGSGVSGADPITFESNRIQNLQLIGPTATELEFIGFRINSATIVPTSFGNDLDTASGNLIGDLLVTANSQSAANIYIKERRNSSGNSFTGFKIEGSSNHKMYHNKIGGLLFDNNSNNGLSANLIYCVGGSDYIIKSNTVGAAVQNITKNCKGDLGVITTKGPVQILGNKIDGVAATGSFANNFDLIQIDADNSKITVVDNKTGNVAPNSVKNNGLVPKSVRGIDILNNATDVMVKGNSIWSVTVESDAATKKADFIGIYSEAIASGSFNVDSNEIFISQNSNANAIGVKLLSADNSMSVNGNKVQAQCRNFFESHFVGLDLYGRITDENKYVVQNNVIGDSSSVASQFPSVYLGGGATGKSETSFGIRITEANDYVLVNSNVIGGVATESNGREIPFIPIVVGNVKDSLRVSDNMIGNSNGTENLSFKNHSEFEYMMYLDLPDGLQNAVIENNTIAGVNFAATSSDARIFGIRATRGTAIGKLTLKGNTIKNIKISGSGEKQFTALYTSNNQTTIIQNKVENIEVKSSKIGDQFFGIYIEEGTSNHTISKNTLENISLVQDQNSANNAVGIFVFGNGSNFDIVGNKISGFNLGVCDSNSLFQGILVNSCLVANINNNVVLHNPGSQVSSQQAYGLYDFARTGDINIYHNTIDIKVDMVPAGRGRTAAYYKNNDAKRVISNNIFVNRSTSAGGPHYALYFASSTGAIGSDFNLLHSTSTPKQLVLFGIDYDIYGWRSKSFGLKSIAPPSQNFVNAQTGMQLTSLGNDIGLSTLGISTDFRDSLRPKDGGYDLGAFEVETATLPSGVTSVFDLERDRSSEIELYPNPANNYVRVKGWADFSNQVQYRITNSAGQIVNEGILFSESDEIELDNLKAGLYLIEFIDSENTQQQPVRFTKL